MLKQPVPEFELPASGGTQFRLSGQRGKKLLVYFYPKDNTPGCTVEGQQFRDLHPQFAQRNCVIVGISRDSVKSHENFKAKHGFPFDLLSDCDETVCNLFGVIKQKNMYGKQVRGIERSSFLIDENGVLVRQWRGVKADGHAQAVLNELDQL